jgi:glycerol-3-phosphate dehydrogenase
LKKKYDILIIGAGVIGTAIARILSRYEISLKVVEKEIDVGFATTKANSGIVHSGYDDKPKTLKAKLVVEGNSLYENWCRELAVPFKRTGSLVVAMDEEESKIIDELYKRGIENKVEGLKILKRDEILALEPNLNPKSYKALYAPSAGVTSPYELAIAQFENAKENGVDFEFESEVENIEVENKKFTVKTKKGKITSFYLINCAGVFADKISQMVGINDFKITPVKGEYYLCDKEIGNLVNHIIFPTPTKISKGILVAPTVEGNIFFGPNAVKIKDKKDTSTTEEGLREVFEGAKKLVPSLTKKYIITNFSGIRSDAGEDFIIRNYPNLPNFINVAGIKSPGLTCVPSIANLVLNILKENLKFIPKKNFKEKRKNFLKFRELNFQQIDEIIKINPEFGEIVCRCENVSVYEVKEAIRRGANTLDGIKYRTRCGMGRCQGGFCTPKVLKILRDELSLPLKKITKFGKNSYLIYKETK